jgi:cell division protein FtsQ
MSMANIKKPKKRRLRRKGNRFRKPRRIIPWRRLLIGGLWGTMALASLAMVVAVAYFAGQMLFASDYFKVDRILVENNHRIGRDQILALSDIRAGTNIFELDLARVSRRIEENPWISRAKVRRLFPDQLVIKVEERVPKAIIRLDYLYYLDASGHVFKRLERGDRLDFPVVTGIDRQALLDAEESTLRQLDEVLKLLDMLQERSIFGMDNVSELRFEDTAGITLYTCSGGVPVRIGKDDFEAKLDRLEKIYPQIRTRLGLIDYIDLNVTRRIIVKLDAGNVRGKG